MLWPDLAWSTKLARTNSAEHAQPRLDAIASRKDFGKEYSFPLFL